jgi:branched-chain amino acid transport system ATP-binding protein
MTAVRVEQETPVGVDALRTEQIIIAFGGLVAVNAVTFNVPQGGIVSLIGPNGANKTTLFNVLTRLCRPTAGRVYLDERDVTGKPPHKIAAMGPGPHVPEHPAVPTS